METLITILGTAIYKIIELFEFNELDSIFLPKARRRTINWLNKFVIFILQIILMAILGYSIYKLFGSNNLVLNLIAKGLINIISTVALLLVLFKKIEYCQKIIKLTKRNVSFIFIIIWIALIISFSIVILGNINFNDLLIKNFILCFLGASIYSIVLIIILSFLVAVYYDKNIAKYYFYKNNKKYYIYYTQIDDFVVYGTGRNFEAVKQFLFIDINELKKDYEIYIDSDNT